MNKATSRLLDWRLWAGSTALLGLQVIISINLRYQADGVSANSESELWQKIMPLIIWYLPVIISAPFIVAYAPMTRLKTLGWPQFILTNSILVIGATLALQVTAIGLLFMLFDNHWGMNSIISMISYYYTSTPWHADLLLVFGLFAMGYSLDYAQRLGTEEVHSAKLKTELVNAELQALKSQLNPHFLFNVLNGISGLVRSRRNDEATDALSDLSSMLRSILENRNQEMVAVSNELELINNYLALQQMRFRDKLKYKVIASEEVLRLKIPFMVLQPLVENAIHHGAQMERDDNLVTLHLYKSGADLEFVLTNRMPQKAQQGGFGIGIGTNRERLQKIYGDKFELQLNTLPDRYFETKLKIPHGDTID